MSMVTSRALGSAAIIASALFCAVTNAVAQAVTENRPAGYQTLTERYFSAADELGWGDNQGSSSWSIVTDPSATNSRVGRITYQVGSRGGWLPNGARSNFGNFSTSNLYVSFRVKHSGNWQNHPHAVNKVLYITDSSYSGNGDPMYLNYYTGSGAPYFQVRTQGSLETHNYQPNVENVPAPKGQWHRVELVLVMNSSPGASDGQLHMWVNGKKTSEYRNMRWSNGARKWDSVRWEPIWGGTGSTVNQEMNMEMDYFHISSGDGSSSSNSSNSAPNPPASVQAQ